ncbi:MAG: hypothetical protein A2X67_12950 [Ignavibacteria bacterium GWA2_55_11]|nr:MAG: hypothetical protein A2X67_12950 [Ignavibacteria bacterium GWA2_55_11]OGU45787.1 MAG: hypothetical protein A2X68_01485 [Ignavibacteria bacterium GWC2_56_12]OGU68225.1 MAG: hypothetical protein A3C56_02170 [Ignavibacteria bacterium RIFCSPHIGHO2_02_FULL_56_12]OGU68879.1 MAG: hypothetical protein A3H45_00290 [Ignavibacteria bacterium RIFCSPLOWO2_02_FULL_55_14]OGU76271.1 MAG: hypothetical protein A3G43_11015 [Ignavibacteria bacterium RIFCSPLOWO2_12_FULL_56_21]HAV23656.1 hypothetical protei
MFSQYPGEAYVTAMRHVRIDTRGCVLQGSRKGVAIRREKKRRCGNPAGRLLQLLGRAAKEEIGMRKLAGEAEYLEKMKT